ncbi:MAG: hypothetical protein ABIS07_03975 [Dokdonella sp.]
MDGANKPQVSVERQDEKLLGNIEKRFTGTPLSGETAAKFSARGQKKIDAQHLDQNNRAPSVRDYDRLTQ